MHWQPMHTRASCLSLPFIKTQEVGMHELATSQSLTRNRVILLIALSCLLIGRTQISLCEETVGISSQNARYLEFKQFLSNKRPPIAYVNVARSSLFYFNNGKQWTNDVEYEASLQPNTFYVKQLGTSYDPNTNSCTIAGVSYFDKWYVNEYYQVTIASQDPAISGTNTPLEKITAERLNLLEDVLNLGIFGLNSHSVIWSNDNFVAVATRPEESINVSGHIVGDNASRPDYMEYRCSNRKELTYKVTFKYIDDGNRPSWMPYKIITAVSSLQPGARVISFNNTVEQLVIGLTNVGKFGYVYKDFLPLYFSVTNGNLVVYSNGVGYVRLGNSYQTVLSPTTTLLSNPRKLKAVRILFYIVIFLSVIIFWWLATRGPQGNETDKNK